jgi:hypothetical protein
MPLPKQEAASRKTRYMCYFLLAFFLRFYDCRINMNAQPMFLRRLGPDPHENGALTPAARGCPDIFELASGDFAVIGIDITETSVSHLPLSAGCGPDERIVLVPRKTLILAKSDIPSKV